MIKPVYLYSAKTLQNWNPDTPFLTGIGGSETAHIELHKNLSIGGILPISYAPLEIELPNYWVNWTKSERVSEAKPGILINYRDASLYDNSFVDQHVNYFVAQDCDYPWTPERLNKIDRYICLCDEHAKYTAGKYKELDGKVYISSNGVRAGYIKNYWSDNIPRFDNRVIYASSPDRGLKLLLEQWWRIRERVPNAELKIAYGFDNVEKIIQLMGGSEFHQDLRDSLTKLFDQPGVEWMGRLPQDKLYELWFSSNVWAYGSDWPETSCITCMDAQACGVTPVVTNYWAQGENCDPRWAVHLPNLPQKDKLSRSIYIEEIINKLRNPQSDKSRREMANAAMAKFDWKNIAKQFTTWIKKDSK